MPHYAPFRYPYKTQISPAWTAPPRVYMEDCFALYIQNFDDEPAQRYFTVHVPKSVQTSFHEGLVRGFHLQYIPFEGGENTEVSRAIPGGPVWVVLGVELQDGTRIDCVPRELDTLFKQTLSLAVATCAVGAALSLTPYAWIGGLLFGYGLFRVRYAFKVPRKVHWPMR